MTQPSMLPARWSLAGRRALVTGGSKGIGAAAARELLALGAQVTIAARGASEIEARRAEWDAEFAGRIHSVAADVTAIDGRAEIVHHAVEAMGGLDILVNNVGTNIRKASLDFSPEEFETVFDTNLRSLWEMCRAAHPYLKESAGGGSIVNIGSVAGSTAVGSGAPYAMTKAAIDQLTRYLAVEWAPDLIRVNGVNPWYTRTPLASLVLDNPEFEARVLTRTPAGRIADAEDISGAIAFLCLPVAKHITGQTLAVDGGFLAYGLPFNAA